MTDERKFAFATTLDAVAAGEALARVLAVRDDLVREAIEALMSGKTVVITAHGEEISRYVPEALDGD